jgi:hypothetical protein
VVSYARKEKMEFANYKFGILKYLQMAEGLGYLASEELESSFSLILSDEQHITKYVDAKKFCRKYFGILGLLH